MSEDWKTIQRWASVAADGQPGPATARAIIAKAGIAAPGAAAPAAGAGMVRGNGSNIRRVFIHCTATREGQAVSVETIRKWHRDLGWKDIGYHFVINIDGSIDRGRDEAVPGSHVAGFNTGSIGVVYVGGLAADGKTSKDTRTPAQREAMARLVRDLVAAYPGADVLGHRDASPDKDGDGVIEKHEWLKDCPCFYVRAWWSSVK